MFTTISENKNTHCINLLIENSPVYMINMSRLIQYEYIDVLVPKFKGVHYPHLFLKNYGQLYALVDNKTLKRKHIWHWWFQDELSISNTITYDPNMTFD